ncbi:hypothetical protein BO70DRAFT_303101 [Aspergillus heteromorphus CBS 117.55]|uniref:Protein-lysine N-methyltransferase EFM6 n=1 Tax=Aspergillus heteromorphus CBS 117.55 TaxID=1448321 RepID=A0A317UUM6_9EURO|nr:uncharacterized protein BO70DRAFT_303101 [Aspergillus heteromorphus CBS 117.55]PWY64247.1 hypothetical protein BO70DRAFT_303101 [Aspergillus heteromorphus CBS 117.55]
MEYLPSLIDPNETFNVNESLVPLRDLKTASQSSISLDGLLQNPLILQEDLKEGCGGQLWPAGMVLSKYLLRQHRSSFLNKTIVELGAGGGLVGLAVARGCNIGLQPIYITDQTSMLPLMETNIKLNGLSSVVAATVLNWGEPLPTSIPRHPTIILAADCVYFEPAFPLLISTLSDLLGPNSVCYFCFKRRRRADIRFMKQARKIFHVKEISDDPDADAYRRENIYLYAIRRKLDKNMTATS